MTEWSDVALAGVACLSSLGGAYLAYLAQRNTRTKNGVTVGEHVDNVNRPWDGTERRTPENTPPPENPTTAI